MPTAGTSDADRQVGFAFTFVKRQEVLEHVREPIDSFANLVMLIEKLPDLRILTRQIF